MESGNITSRRSNFCLESLVMPGEVQMPKRKKGRPLGPQKDIGPRPKCPKCGTDHVLSLGKLQLRCGDCKKTWAKSYSGKDRKPGISGFVKDYSGNPKCPRCGEHMRSSGKKQWRCHQCNKMTLKEKTQFLKSSKHDGKSCVICGGRTRVTNGRTRCRVCDTYQPNCTVPHTERFYRRQELRYAIIRAERGAKPVQGGNLAERLQSVCPQGAQMLIIGGHQIS